MALQRASGDDDVGGDDDDDDDVVGDDLAGDAGDADSDADVGIWL